MKQNRNLSEQIYKIIYQIDQTSTSVQQQMDLAETYENIILRKHSEFHNQEHKPAEHKLGIIMNMNFKT